MPHDRHSQYRGSEVTVRWAKLKRSGSAASAFTAGYRVTSEDGQQSHWRHFSDLPFATSDTAVVHALGEAHRFIDAQGSAHAQDGADGSAP